MSTREAERVRFPLGSTKKIEGLASNAGCPAVQNPIPEPVQMRRLQIIGIQVASSGSGNINQFNKGNTLCLIRRKSDFS